MCTQVWCACAAAVMPPRDKQCRHVPCRVVLAVGRAVQNLVGRHGVSNRVVKEWCAADLENGTWCRVPPCKRGRGPVPGIDGRRKRVLKSRLCISCREELFCG